MAPSENPFARLLLSLLQGLGGHAETLQEWRWAPVPYSLHDDSILTRSPHARGDPYILVTALHRYTMTYSRPPRDSLLI